MSVLKYILLASAAVNASRLPHAKRLTDGSSPSGTVPSDTISGCTYWVNVQTGDKCQDIYGNYGISAQTLLQYNPSLKSDCSGLKVGYSYCIEVNYGLGPTTSSKPVPTTTSTTKTTSTPSGPSPTQSGIAANCKSYYKAVSGDTCTSISDNFGTFTVSQFVSWNPAVQSDCTKLFAGYYYCVAVPGTPTSKPATTASPSPTGPSPTQSGIVSNCKTYYKAVSGDTCTGISDKYGTFTVSQFVSWNPAVQSDCTKLFAGYYYCVGVPGTPTTKPTKTTSTSPTATGPSPTQSGIIGSCTKYYKAVSGDTCAGISDKYGTFTTAQFIKWNPAVGSDCTKLFAGYYYCIAIPGTPTKATTSSKTPTPTPKGPQPQQPNITKSCKKYYKVVSGDTCYDIEQKYGITAKQFNTWNPDVKTDCSKLLAGYYVCIGV